MMPAKLITVVEAPVFVRRAEKLLSPEEHHEVINQLAAYPEEGDEIPGTGGVRRFGLPQRAGARPWRRKENKAMGTVAQDLLDSMQFMVNHMEGKAEGKTHVVEVADDVDVKAIRQSLNMTQEVFAQTYHLEIGALRAWEQKRRRPEKAARLYLKVIAKNPDMVRDAIRA